MNPSPSSTPVALTSPNNWPEAKIIILEPNKRNPNIIQAFAAKTEPSNMMNGDRMYWFATSDPNRMGIGFESDDAASLWVLEHGEKLEHLTVLDRDTVARPVPSPVVSSPAVSSREAQRAKPEPSKQAGPTAGAQIKIALQKQAMAANNDQRILDALAAGPATGKEIAALTGLSNSTILGSAGSRLLEAQVVKKRGRGLPNSPFIFSLPGDARTHRNDCVTRAQPVAEPARIIASKQATASIQASEPSTLLEPVVQPPEPQKLEVQVMPTNPILELAFDAEVIAMHKVVLALEPLPRITQMRVLSWLTSRLDLA